MTEHIVGNAKEINDLIPGMHYHSMWDSPMSFGSHIAALDPNKAWCKAGWNGDEDFCGTKTMDEALLLSREGWKEGTSRVERLRNHILALNPTYPKLKKFSMAGAYPDVPRAISGNPLNMRTLESAKSRRRPVLTLLSNMSANWSVPKDTITNRASVVCAIIDQIEAAGFACEVIAVSPTRGGSHSLFGRGGRGDKGFLACTSIMVKRSNQMVDINRLSFGLGHSAMFRRMVFADWGSHPALEEGIGHNLGCSYQFETPALNFKNIFVLPSAEGNKEAFKTEEASAKLGVALIIKSLKDQGCPAFTKELWKQRQDKPITVKDYKEEESF